MLPPISEAEKHAQAERARASFQALDAESAARQRVREALRALAADAVTILGRGLATGVLAQLERGWQRGH